jgi:hypothetical protein
MKTKKKASNDIGFLIAEIGLGWHAPAQSNSVCALDSRAVPP